jgi:hypothetical protein
LPSQRRSTRHDLTEEVTEHMAEPQNQPQQGTQDAPPATGSANPPDAPQNPPQDAQRAAGPAAGDHDGDDLAAETDLSKLRHEAASRRRQLRTVEAENVALRERIDARDRAEVEAIASSSLADPSDFTAAVELDSLRGEDGAVDLDAVEASIGELLKAKPHYALGRTAPNLHQGYREPEPQAGPSFGQQLKQGGR